MRVRCRSAKSRDAVSCVAGAVRCYMIGLLVIAGFMMASPAMASDVSRFTTLYGELLKQFWRPTVSIHGIETTVFDYAAIKQEGTELIAEISGVLAKIDPDDIGNQEALKAFWINVYNFSAMRLVIDAYPVDSITSFKISLIKHPWSKKAVIVGGRRYSLSEIEKDILLERFSDKRIIFAVSCAAVSCPDRTPEPFETDKVNDQLVELIREFYRNPKKGSSLNRENKTLTLSWILKKDAHLFYDVNGGVIAFVRPYLDQDTQDFLSKHPVAIDYFDHDWTLNDLAQAGHP